MPAHNVKGRSKKHSSFFMLQHAMTKTAAWRALTPYEVRVFIELGLVFNGRNNGYLGFSVRRAAERCGINKDTVSKCLRRLEELGFIERAARGSFHLKSRHSAEYRITSLKCDRTGLPGSKAYERWKPTPGATQGARQPGKPETRSLPFGQAVLAGRTEAEVN